MENPGDMSVRGISGEGESGSRIRMNEGNCGGEGRLSSLEGGGTGRTPSESLGGASESISERLKDTGGMRDKTVVEIHEAEETLEIFISGGRRESENGVHVAGKGFEAGGRDGVTKEVHGGLGKGALGGVDIETIGGKDNENLAEMVQVIRMGGGGDEDIIQVDKDKGKLAEEAVHKALEGLHYRDQKAWQCTRRGRRE